MCLEFVFRANFVLQTCHLTMAQKLIRRFFLSKKDRSPYWQCIFQMSFSPRAQNTILERAGTKGTRVGAPRGLLIFRHAFGHGFLRKTVADFARFFYPFFPCPQKIHAKSTPPKSPNARQFWNSFSSGFSGCSSMACVTAIGCQYFYADQPRLVS